MRSVAILNESTVSPELTMPALEQMANALYRQAIDHWAPFSEQCAPESIIVVSKKSDIANGSAVMTILDDLDVEGALGYHDRLPNGQPLARIGLKPILENGGTLMRGNQSLSVTLSHELLEMLGDPYCSWWADYGDIEDAIELCDRVESDSYEIEDVSVSDFLGPRAFRDGDGPYDWMGTLKSPFEIRPGGYAIRRSGGPTGQVRQDFGMAYPDWKRKQKILKARHIRRHSWPGTENVFASAFGRY